MTIELTHEQAVVLSDLLYRISEREEYYEDIGNSLCCGSSKHSLIKSSMNRSGKTI